MDLFLSICLIDRFFIRFSHQCFLRNWIWLFTAEWNNWRGKRVSVMAGNTQDSSSQSFWEGYKEFWGERFSFMSNYSKFIKRDKPLTSWSDSDVEEFIASDPVHGPVVMVLQLFYLHFCLFLSFCAVWLISFNAFDSH